MILGYKTHYPKWMTKKGRQTFFPEKIGAGIKIHSIREDKHNRWKVGMSIQHATGVRTKNYNKFKEDKCKFLQSIWISYHPHFPEKKIVSINGRVLKQGHVAVLAKNDGFDCVEDFFEWFGIDGKHIYRGKIIHWTDLKYFRQWEFLDK